MSESLELEHEADRSRYLGRLDSRVVTSLTYRLRGSTMIITSTVTDPVRRGAGLAGTVTRFALDDARARGLQVIPSCPYAADWIERHPEYRDLLAPRGA